MKVICTIVLILVLATTSLAFEIPGGANLRNQMSLSKADSDFFPMRFEYIGKMTFRGTNLWLKDVYQHDYGNKVDDVYFNRFFVGYKVYKGASVYVERQSYSNRDTVRRIGIEVVF